MIDRSHGLPLRRQAEVLQLSRSILYYEPRPVPAADLAAMRRIDELHLDQSRSVGARRAPRRTRQGGFFGGVGQAGRERCSGTFGRDLPRLSDPWELMPDGYLGRPERSGVARNS
jgi:hypothetical protein